MDPGVSGCQSGQIRQKRCSPVWLSQQSEEAGTGDEGPLFVLEFLGSLCHPPLVQVQSPTREEDHVTLAYIISLSLNSWNPRLQNMSQQAQGQTGPRDSDSITSRNSSPEQRGRAHKIVCVPVNSLGQTWGLSPCLCVEEASS